MGLFDKVTGVLSGGASADISLNVDKTTFKKGETINYTYTVKPKTNFNCRAVRIELSSTEVAIGSGKNCSQNTSFAVASKKELFTTKDFTEGRREEGSGAIQIPTYVQPTYKGQHAHNKWFLNFIIDIAMGLDLRKHVEIKIE